MGLSIFCIFKNPPKKYKYAPKKIQNHQTKTKIYVLGGFCIFRLIFVIIRGIFVLFKGKNRWGIFEFFRFFLAFFRGKKVGGLLYLI